MESKRCGSCGKTNEDIERNVSQAQQMGIAVIGDFSIKHYCPKCDMLLCGDEKCVTDNGGYTIYCKKCGTEVVSANTREAARAVYLKNIDNVSPIIEQSEETVTDIDGNVYHTIKLGNQVWTVENLKTTKYNDGSSIRFESAEEYFEEDFEDEKYLEDEEYIKKFLGIFPVKKVRTITKTRKIPKNRNTILENSNKRWSKLKEGALCWHNNNIRNKNDNGGLYNWYAVKTGKLALKGWHVPTESEWNELEKYLIANGFNYDGTKVDNKIAKSMAAKSYWVNDNDAGTIGNDSSKNNRSGFSGLAGGCRNNEFLREGYAGIWWSASEYGNSQAIVRVLNFGSNYLRYDRVEKWNGYSVRLVRD